MKNKTFKKFTSLILVVLLLGATAFVSLGKFIKVVFAQENNTSENFIGYTYSGNLYSQTNTFTYNESTKTYNVSEEGRIPGADVSEDAPLITVITHGLDESASNWSNNSGINFAPNEDSILSVLNETYKSKTGQDANVYWAKLGKKDSNICFKLIPLIENNVENGLYIEDGSTISQITDISKHIIIVFEAYATGGSNNEVYEEFNYMLSKIVYDVKYLNNGVLPKINLIGHSRGGITNLQYALDHPLMVDSMFALGTPFFGSSSAMTMFGDKFAPGVGRLDIVNRSLYTSYHERWSSGYQNYYSNIKGYALGGYSDLDFLIDRLQEWDGLITEVEWLTPNVLETIRNGVKLLPGVVQATNIAAELTNYLLSILRDEDYQEGEWEALLIEVASEIQYIDQYDGLLGSLLNYVQCPVFHSDVLVHLSSQLGEDEYSATYRNYNFTTYVKQFKDGNSDTTKRADPGKAGVVHNLETMDRDMINYIASRISMDSVDLSADFYYSVDKNSNVTIVGAKNINSNGTLVIPSQINNGTVVAIGYKAFNESGIANVVLPDSVKEIGDYAFANLAILTQVSLNSTSQLEKIGNRAFFGNGKLKTFGLVQNNLTLPNALLSVGDNAFYGTFFDSIAINQNLNTIGAGAFSNMSRLASISVNSQNQSYYAYNNVLYSNSGDLIQYPIASTNSSFTVPSIANKNVITRIREEAFSGATHLTSISLNGITNIDDYAFYDCGNLSTITNANNLEYLGYAVFYETAFHNKNDEFLTIGKFLYKYNGNHTTLTKDDFPSSVEKIAMFAFSGATNLESIVLPDEINYIQDYAFFGCSSLEFARFEGVTLPEFDTIPYTGIKKYFTFYCRESLVDYMSAMNVLWWKSEIIVEPITTKAYFVDCDTTVDFYFGSNVTLPDQAISGYYNRGWQRVNEEYEVLDEEYLSSSLVCDEITPSVIFKADLIEIKTYTLRFYNGDTNFKNITISVGDYYAFDKYSYSLNGQTYSLDNQQEMEKCAYGNYYGPAVVNGVDVAEFSYWRVIDVGEELSSGQWFGPYPTIILKVYSIWEPARFNLTINNEFAPTQNTEITFFDEVNLGTPSRQGYQFVKWVDEDENTVTVIRKTTNDVTVTAVWSLIYYDISYNNIVFAGEQAAILLNNSYLYTAPTTFTYGSNLSLANVTANFSSTDPYAPKLKFLGWYTDMTFTTQVLSIPSTQANTMYVYAKWRYDFGYGNRTGNVTAGTNISTNDYDSIYLKLSVNNLYENLLALGIEKIAITFKINVVSLSLVNNFVRFYGGADGTTLLQSFNLGALITDVGVHTIDFEFDLEELGAIDYIYIKYLTSWGTWTNDQIYYEIQYCVVATDKNNPDFSWSYQDPFEE